MKKNPFLRALAAFLYIVTISFILSYGSTFAGEEDTVWAPIAMLSLFVFSASLMGYIFCLEPLRLYLDNKKDEGVSLFIKTVGYFGLITFIVFSLMFVF